MNMVGCGGISRSHVASNDAFLRWLNTSTAIIAFPAAAFNGAACRHKIIIRDGPVAHHRLTVPIIVSALLRDFLYWLPPCSRRTERGRPRLLLVSAGEETQRPSLPSLYSLTDHQVCGVIPLLPLPAVGPSRKIEIIPLPTYRWFRYRLLARLLWALFFVSSVSS